MKKSPIYIAYYTVDTLYEDEIRKLKKSLDNFNLPHDIQAISSLGSWQENTKFKAIFIQNMLFKYTDTPVIYLDADSIVKQPPTLFNELDCDIAAHYYVSKTRPEKELLSGTLYLGPSCKTKKLVQLWRLINEEYPLRWEQKNLALAINFMPEIKLVDLPPTYCMIFDLMKEKGEAVIEHFQASRRYKMQRK